MIFNVPSQLEVQLDAMKKGATMDHDSTAAQPAMKGDGMMKEGMKDAMMKCDKMKKDGKASADDMAKCDKMMKDMAMMKKDSMAKDSMAKDSMKKDSMSKDSMKHDSMQNEPAKKY